MLVIWDETGWRVIMRFTLEFPVFTVKKLLSLKKKGNLNLNPGFQRNSVWEEKTRHY